MTVILDWAKARDCYLVPGPPQDCSFCGDSLAPPFMHWMATAVDYDDELGKGLTGADIFVCARCCHWHRRGFAADMARVDAIQEALSARPDCPTLQAVQ